MKSIRFGLITRIALLVVGVELVAFGSLGWFYTDRYSAAAEKQIRSRLRLVGQMIANDELAVSAVSRQSLVSNLVGAPYLGGMVIGGNGRVIVSTNPAYLGRPANDVPGLDARWLADSAPAEQFVAGDDTLTCVTHVHNAAAGAPLYYTVIRISTAELNAQKQAIVWWGRIGSGLFILLSSAGIVFLAQRLITRRVRTSLAVLKEVEGGALDARIPVSSNDELGLLQRGINSMTAEVGALLNQHRRNEEELGTILNAIGDGVIAVGPDGGVLRCNPSAAAVLGKSIESIENSRLEELLPELAGDDPQRWWRAPESLTAAGRVRFERPGPDGMPRSIELGHGPIRDPDGSVVGAVLVLQDITERKHYELALEREAQEWTQAMDSFADAIYLLDMDRRVVRANKAFYALVGSDPDHALGRHFAELAHPRGEHGQCPVCRAQEEKRDVVVTLEADDPNNVAGYPAEVTVRVIRDIGGKPHYLLGSIHDLTNTRKFESELRRLNESLEQRVQEEVAKNREKDAMLIQQSRLATMGEMLHNIAHQWRQPLSAMSLIFNNIQDDFNYGELSRESLEKQVGTGVMLAQKMSATIDDFRNFFQPDHAPSRFNLKDSIREALHLMEASFRNNEIRVVVEAEEDIYVEGYANEYSQVLLNVLSNAKDVLIGKRGSGVVTLSAVKNGDMGEVHVRDNGGGIPENILPKIFDPYFTTKESGTGIGLYMSRMITSHMHGQITAQNVEGGAEFVIAVPIAS